MSLRTKMQYLIYMYIIRNNNYYTLLIIIFYILYIFVTHLKHTKHRSINYYTFIQKKKKKNF